MKSKNIAISFSLLFVVVILSGCAGAGASSASSWPGLSVDQENAYLAYNQYVHSINLSNGLEKWRFPLEGKNQISYYAAPTMTSDGQLLVGDYTNLLHSLNPANGQENWSFSQAGDRYIGSPLSKGERIFAPNAGNQLYALDTNGNQLWEFETGGPLWAKPTTEFECECIYVPSMDHHLYAVNAQSGVQEWQSEAFGGSIVGTPAISPDGETLYVGTFANEILAINSNNGEVIWRTPTSNFVWGGPILQDERVYVGDLSGVVYAVDAQTGNIAWQTQTDGEITGSPLVTDDTIYVVTGNGYIYAFDKEGKTLWNKQLGGKLQTTPVSAGELILVASTDSDELLFALDNNGNQQWAFTPEK